MSIFFNIFALYLGDIVATQLPIFLPLYMNLAPSYNSYKGNWKLEPSFEILVSVYTMWIIQFLKISCETISIKPPCSYYVRVSY